MFNTNLTNLNVIMTSKGFLVKQKS